MPVADGASASGDGGLEDAELLERVGTGDRVAMRSLYERHSDALYRFIRARTGDPFEAADVMQEAFLEVWRSAARFQGRSSVKTWIYGIGRNKAADRARRSRRVVVQEPDPELPDDAPDPAAVIEAASDAARLRECIGGLGPNHRSAIQLAFYDDLSYPEIAVVEGVPLGTVKTRIHHAKQLLMRCLTALRSRPA
jgi:RNA polymerase sigma-70 factor, ECF subfamily